MLMDPGHETKSQIAVDAKATLHIIHQRRLGKLKYVSVHHLWIQVEVRRHRLLVKEVHTSANPADMGTQSLRGELLQ